ncbi:MAG: GNAT family N-acetyltransferase [Candidatus Sericytochromatia bacterium]|nr:GNAT family N-acetyltransferase [Candidatus Sericytochromatia bacterium]
MTEAVTFEAGGLTVRQLDRTAQEGVQTLLTACDDYAVMLTGRPHGPEAATDLFAALPPGRDEADKLVFGIGAPEAPLIGIIDMIREYPEPGVWFLGLLMLDPAHRSQGLGAQAYEALAEYAFAEGCDSIRIGVVKENERALTFWSRQGFHELVRQPLRMGDKDTEAVIMEDVLVAADE